MTKRTPFDALMDEVCVERGWCGAVVDDQPLHVTDFIPRSGQVTAAQFAEWVFHADGVDPKEDFDKWQKHIDGLRVAFVRHMGSDSIDAEQLRWDVS